MSILSNFFIELMKTQDELKFPRMRASPPKSGPAMGGHLYMD